MYTSKDIILNNFCDSEFTRDTRRRVLELQLEYLKDVFAYVVEDCGDLKILAAAMHFVTEWGLDPEFLPVELRGRVREVFRQREAREKSRIKCEFDDDWTKYWDQLDEQVNI